jgi:hypothetical protein
VHQNKLRVKDQQIIKPYQTNIKKHSLLERGVTENCNETKYYQLKTRSYVFYKSAVDTLQMKTSNRYRNITNSSGKKVTTNLPRAVFAIQHTIIYNTPHFRRYLLQQNKLTERLNRRQYNTQRTFRAVFYGGVENYTICKKNRYFAIHTGIIALSASTFACKRM